MNYPIKKCSCFGVWIFFVIVMLLISVVGGYIWFTSCNASCESSVDSFNNDIETKMKQDPRGESITGDSPICERAMAFSEDSYEDANISAEAKAYIDNNCRVNVSGSSKRSASATVNAQSTSPLE